MHAYLLVGRDESESVNQVNQLIKKAKAKRLDFEVAKIADVRDLGHFTSLTFAEKTAVVVKNLETASEEAQNAFLKALEEPQRNLVYILTTRDQDLLLPTIVSRCQIVEVKTKKSKLKTTTQNSKVQEFLGAGVGERLRIISQITKREEAVEFLTNFIVNVEPQLAKNPKLAYFLEAASQALAAINANGNVSLQLTNFVVNYE